MKEDRLLKAVERGTPFIIFWPIRAVALFLGILYFFLRTYRPLGEVVRVARFFLYFIYEPEIEEEKRRNGTIHRYLSGEITLEEAIQLDPTPFGKLFYEILTNEDLYAEKTKELWRYKDIRSLRSLDVPYVAELVAKLEKDGYVRMWRPAREVEIPLPTDERLRKLYEETLPF